MDEVGSNELDEPSIPWRPRQLAFGQYRQESEPANKEQILRVVVRRPVSVFIPLLLSFWIMLLIWLILLVVYVGFNLHAEYERFGFNTKVEVKSLGFEN